MKKDFGGVVWTNHALQKLRQRNIKQGDAWAAWRRPDQSRFANNKGAWIYYKSLGDQKIEVVAKQNEKKQWVILSVWSKRVSGEEKQKKSFWNRIFSGSVTLGSLLYVAVLFSGYGIVYPALYYSLSKRLDKLFSTNISEILTNMSTPLPMSTPPNSPTPTISPSPIATATATPVATTTAVSATPAPVVNNAPPGAGYSRQSVSTDAGVFSVSMVASDIGSTRVIVDTASPSDCGGNCPALSLSDYVSRNGGFAGVNGTYFCPRDYASCAGKENSFDLLVMNKDKVYFNSDNNVYSNNPAVIFGGGYVRFVSSGSQWGRDTGVNGVIMNYPLLVANGQITFGGDDDPKKGSKGSRSFVATKAGTVYIGVVHSATVAESARVMNALGMENAMNLDNGGSTALWYGGYKVGPGRAIPNAIIFTR